MDQNETQPVDVMTLDPAGLPKTPQASPQHSAEAKREAYQHSRAPKDNPEKQKPETDDKTKPKDKATAAKATAELTQSEGEAGVYMCMRAWVWYRVGDL